MIDPLAYASTHYYIQLQLPTIEQPEQKNSHRFPIEYLTILFNLACYCLDRLFVLHAAHFSGLREGSLQ